MTALTKPLDKFIAQQLETGQFSSEVEAEKMIVSAVAERTIDRKIARAETQIENGQFSELNNDYIDNFMTRAKNRNLSL